MSFMGSLSDPGIDYYRTVRESNRTSLTIFGTNAFSCQSGKIEQIFLQMLGPLDIEESKAKSCN
jgi:hypothetical protein